MAEYKVKVVDVRDRSSLKAGLIGKETKVQAYDALKAAKAGAMDLNLNHVLDQASQIRGSEYHVFHGSLYMGSVLVTRVN